MTDLTTPVSEDADMSKFVSLFRRAADAIVAQSTMQQQINDFTGTVSALQAEVDTLRSAKTSLENTVSELYDVKAQLAKALDQQALDTRTIQGEQNQVAQLTDELERCRKERDEHHFALLQANDDLNSINARHAKLKALLVGEANDAVTKAIQVPIVEHVPPTYVYPEPTPTPPPVQQTSDPVPLVEPTPAKPWWDKPDALSTPFTEPYKEPEAPKPVEPDKPYW